MRKSGSIFLLLLIIQHWREGRVVSFTACSWSLPYKLDIRLGGSHGQYGCGDKKKIKTWFSCWPSHI